MLQQLVFHQQQIVKDTRVQELDPRPCENNDHSSVLAYEMETIEPGENSSRTLTWKPLAFLSHIKLRTNDDRFSSSQGESFLCHSVSLFMPLRFSYPTPFLLGPPQQGSCNAFSYDIFGDHLQTCQVKSSVSQVHDWVVYKVRTLLGSVGHRVKIHKITPTTVKELGDLEVKDYIVLQKPQAQDNHLQSPLTLVTDFTMTHVRFGLSLLHPMGQLTNTRRSDGAPDPDGVLKTSVRI